MKPLAITAGVCMLAVTLATNTWQFSIASSQASIQHHHPLISGARALVGDTERIPFDERQRSLSQSHGGDPFISRSLFAVGLTARSSKLMTCKNFTITAKWNDAAEKAFLNFFHSVQFGDECIPTLKYALSPQTYGITSQIRDFMSAMLFLNNQNVTIVPPRKSHCVHKPWLSCFVDFPPPCTSNSSGEVESTKLSLVATSFLGNRAYTATRFHGKFFLPRFTRSILKASVEFPHYYFPSRLWDGMVQSGGVWMEDGLGTKLPFEPYMAAAKLKHHDRNFVQMELLASVVKSLLWKHVIPISSHLREQADRAVPLDAHRPVLALHVRGTDKHADEGVASSLPDRYEKDFLRSLIESVQRRSQITFRSIFLLSDERYVQEEVEKAAGEMDTRPKVLTIDVHEFLRQHGVEMSKECPHKCVRKKLTRSEVEEFDGVLFQQMWAASGADYFIGTGSSGVSQSVAQIMGSRQQVDGDSVSYWIEDYAGGTKRVRPSCIVSNPGPQATGQQGLRTASYVETQGATGEPLGHGVNRQL